MNDQRLIECVRGHECLYDQSIREYRKKHARASAWKKVAEEMNSTVSECKKHWMNLRNAYLHAVSRRRRPGNSISKWRYADEMSFLLPFFVPKHQPAESSTSLKLDEILCPNEANSEATDEDRMSTEDEDQPSPQENKNVPEAVLLLEVLKTIKEFKEPEKDMMMMFFLFVAGTVKKFPKLEQIEIKRKIFEAVHETELRLLKKEEEQQLINSFGNEDHVVTEEFSATKSEVEYL